ncbi:MAG TPA: hypothetical protein VJR23_12060 [Candidatus Acidoferrales bacterium]|nr:hypothetical protein [Candidatus Acidoferrales bacterium]
MAIQVAALFAVTRKRLRKFALYATAAFGVLLALVALLFAGEQWRTQAETRDILSAVFSQGIVHNMDQSWSGRPVTIVILRKPICFMCPGPDLGVDEQSWFALSWRSRATVLSNGWFSRASRTTRASFFLNSLFSPSIATDLSLPNGARAVFIKPSEIMWPEANNFEAKFPNNLGYFVVSHVGLNFKKNEALPFVEHFCGGLCGGGGYILVRKENGLWHVVDNRSTWVS